MNIVNLTPHAVKIVLDNGARREIPAQPIPARLGTTVRQVGIIDGIRIFKTYYGIIENLPDPADDTIYIVSKMVRDALPQRTDLYSPANLIRDKDGNVIGCEGLDYSSF